MDASGKYKINEGDPNSEIKNSTFLSHMQILAYNVYMNVWERKCE